MQKNFTLSVLDIIQPIFIKSKHSKKFNHFVGHYRCTLDKNIIVKRKP